MKVPLSLRLVALLLLGAILVTGFRAVSRQADINRQEQACNLSPEQPCTPEKTSPDNNSSIIWTSMTGNLLYIAF